MTDQVEVQKKVRWEDLEVVEEQEITEWEEGNEPVPTYQESLAKIPPLELKAQIEGDWNLAKHDSECLECFDPHCGIDPAKPGGDFTAVPEVIAQGILVVFGISAEDFAEAMEGQARAALEMEIDYLNTPVLGAVDCNNWREVNERLPSIGMMVARINAFCTPSRNNLTGG